MKELPQIYAIRLDSIQDLTLLVHLDEDDDPIDFVAAYGATRVQGNTWTFEDAYFFDGIFEAEHFYSTIKQSIEMELRAQALFREAHRFAEDISDAIVGCPDTYFHFEEVDDDDEPPL